MPRIPFNRLSQFTVRLNEAVPIVAGLALAGTCVVLPAHVHAQEAAWIQISAVLASKDRRDFDPRLNPLKAELRGLPFKGYTLLGIQSCRLEPGGNCAMDIPNGGGYLHVTTTETTTKHCKLRLLLNQQNRPVMNAEIKLNRNAGILLKAARTEMGTVILSIRSSAPPLAAGAPTARRDK